MRDVRDVENTREIYRGVGRLTGITQLYLNVEQEAFA